MPPPSPSHLLFPKNGFRLTVTSTIKFPPPSSRNAIPKTLQECDSRKVSRPLRPFPRTLPLKLTLTYFPPFSFPVLTHFFPPYFHIKSSETSAISSLTKPAFLFFPEGFPFPLPPQSSTIARSTFFPPPLRSTPFSPAAPDRAP